MAIGLGLSFGKKKERTSSNTTTSQNENTTQNTSSSRASNQNSSTSSSGASSSQGSSNTSQTGTVANQRTSGSAAESISRSFGEETQQGLETLVGNLLGQGGRSGAVTDSAISDLSGFDAESFINNTVQAAQGSIQADQDRVLNGLADRIGSAEGNNSMAMLLANRVRNDSAASLAGVRSNAVATGQSIVRDNAAGRVNAAGAENAFLGNLLQSLKGGQQTQTQVGTESQTGTETSATAGTTATSESNTQSAVSQENTQLLEALSQLLTGTTNSTGTENTNATRTSSGGGFSLAI